MRQRVVPAAVSLNVIMICRRRPGSLSCARGSRLFLQKKSWTLVKSSRLYQLTLQGNKSPDSRFVYHQEYLCQQIDSTYLRASLDLRGCNLMSSASIAALKLRNMQMTICTQVDALSLYKCICMSDLQSENILIINLDAL